MWQRCWGCVVAAALLLSACDDAPRAAGKTLNKAAANGAPTVLVDSRHQLRQNGTAGEPYLLSAGPGLVIDASTYALQDPDRRARMANTVRMIYESSILRANWPESGRQAYTLDRSTLTLVKGNAFSGFKAGTQAYIAIGYQPISADGAGEEFIPFWMTSVIFR